MSRAEVRRILGEPTRRIVKNRLDENDFGQGRMESRIKEGWIYGDAPSRHDEVYFDANGKVLGSGSGEG